MSYNFTRKVSRGNKKSSIQEWLKANSISRQHLNNICMFKHDKVTLNSLYETIIEIEARKLDAKVKEEKASNGEKTSTDQQ